MPARIAAVVVAIAMVVGALAFRNNRDADKAVESRPLALVCTPEVASICEELAKAKSPSLEVTIEPAGATYERLVSGERAADDIDGWLSPGPWPGIVDDPQVRRSRLARFATPLTLGFTTTVALVRSDRVAPLTARCNGQVTWGCLAELVGRPWSDLAPRASGFVTPAHEPADADAGGLAVFASIVSGFAGRSDFGATEINDELAARITTFERAIPPEATDADLVDGFVVRPSQFDIVGALATDVSKDALAAGRSRVELVAIAPVVRVPLVFAPIKGPDGARLAQRMRSAGATRVIAAAGWDKQAPNNTITMPPPGVLEALRISYEEVQR